MIDLKYYENKLTLANYSPNTVRIYTFWADLFSKEMEGRYDNEAIETFLSKHHAPTPIYAIIKLCELMNWPYKPPKFRGMSGGIKHPEKYLTTSEVQILCNGQDDMLRLVIQLGFTTGLRASELIGIKISDVDIGKRLITGRGKGTGREGKTYYKVIPERLIHPLTVRLEKLQKDAPNEPRLFPITYHRLYYLIRKAGKLNLKKNVNPHMLRHSSATTLLNSGATIKEVQDHLNHSRADTTLAYIHVDQKHYQESINKAFE